MPKTFITHNVEGEAAVEGHTWAEIQAEAASNRRSRITIESLTEDAEWSEQQRKWWKGVLLPALASDTGDSVLYWETKLKLAILPEDFKPVNVVIEGVGYDYTPSVKHLSMKKMNILIEGSVDHLRDEAIYGDQFSWITLPAKELKK